MNIMAMNKQVCYVRSNYMIAEQTHILQLYHNEGFKMFPGQFINIKINNFLLRRPMSVCDIDHNNKILTIVYKIVGGGTAELTKLKIGDTIDILSGLGNGFDISHSKKKYSVLIGGGTGVAAIYYLAKKLKEIDSDFFTVLGWRDKEQMFYVNNFCKICTICITTQDGSYGSKGIVTDILKERRYDYYFACGPIQMLKSIYNLGVQKKVEGQLSFESRMGCGYGVCMSCTCKTLFKNKRLCKEGPIIHSHEIDFSE
jgi:dihydroorotate dehydrogenase electron transfer subunit